MVIQNARCMGAGRRGEEARESGGYVCKLEHMGWVWVRVRDVKGGVLVLIPPHKPTRLRSVRESILSGFESIFSKPKVYFLISKYTLRSQTCH